MIGNIVNAFYSLVSSKNVCACEKKDYITKIIFIVHFKECILKEHPTMMGTYIYVSSISLS